MYIYIIASIDNYCSQYFQFEAIDNLETIFSWLRIHINIYIYLYKRCTSKSCGETLREYTWVHSILIRSIVEYKEMCFSTWIRTVVNFNQVPKKPNIFSRSLNGEQRKEVLTSFSSFPQKDHLRPSIIG